MNDRHSLSAGATIHQFKDGAWVPYEAPNHILAKQVLASRFQQRVIAGIDSDASDGLADEPAYDPAQDDPQTDRRSGNLTAAIAFVVGAPLLIAGATAFTVKLIQFISAAL